MGLEDFKKAADLRSKIHDLNTELTRLTTQRSANIIEDFADKVLAFLDRHGFQTSRLATTIKATYSASNVHIDLPDATARTIGATVLVPIAVNGTARWKVALNQRKTAQPTQDADAADLSEIERLERLVSDLEKTVSSYDDQAAYTIQYFSDKSQPGRMDDSLVSAASVEDALTAIIEGSS